jgi:hypothetical protein
MVSARGGKHRGTAKEAAVADDLSRRQIVGTVCSGSSGWFASDPLSHLGDESGQRQQKLPEQSIGKELKDFHTKYHYYTSSGIHL